MLLVDGRIAGVWRHTLKGGFLTVEIKPFEALAAGVRQAATAEAERLATYLDASSSWSFGPLS